MGGYRQLAARYRPGPSGPGEGPGNVSRHETEPGPTDGLLRRFVGPGRRTHGERRRTRVHRLGRRVGRLPGLILPVGL
jgi:hypothetical protein